MLLYIYIYANVAANADVGVVVDEVVAGDDDVGAYVDVDHVAYDDDMTVDADNCVYSDAYTDVDADAYVDMHVDVGAGADFDGDVEVDAGVATHVNTDVCDVAYAYTLRW